MTCNVRRTADDIDESNDVRYFSVLQRCIASIAILVTRALKENFVIICSKILDYSRVTKNRFVLFASLLWLIPTWSLISHLFSV